MTGVPKAREMKISSCLQESECLKGKSFSCKAICVGFRIDTLLNSSKSHVCHLALHMYVVLNHPCIAWEIMPISREQNVCQSSCLLSTDDLLVYFHADHLALAALTWTVSADLSLCCGAWSFAFIFMKKSVYCLW